MSISYCRKPWCKHLRSDGMYCFRLKCQIEKGQRSCLEHDQRRLPAEQPSFVDEERTHAKRELPAAAIVRQCHKWIMSHRRGWRKLQVMFLRGETTSMRKATYRLNPSPSHTITSTLARYMLYYHQDVKINISLGAKPDTVIVLPPLPKDYIVSEEVASR